MNYLVENYSDEVTGMINHIYERYIDPDAFGYTKKEGMDEFNNDLPINDMGSVQDIFLQILRNIKNQWDDYDFINFVGWDLERSEDMGEFVQDEDAVDTLVCAIIDMVHYDLYPTEGHINRTELATYRVLVEFASGT